jgi:hypothetical protein
LVTAAGPSPEEAVLTLAQRSAAALELAEAISLATRVEPELLRSCRLAMLPQSHAAIEADVWFSAIMASRTASYAVLRADAQALLRKRLGDNQDRCAQAAKVLAISHRGSPPALRQEEEITWRAMMDPDDPELVRLLEEVVSGLREGKRSLARWAARALPRFPEAVRSLPSAWRVSLEASKVLGGRAILTGAPPKQGLAGILGERPDRSPKTPLSLRLFPGSLELCEPPLSGAQTIEVPRTNPVVVQVSWQGEAGEESQLISMPLGSRQAVHGAGAGQIEVLTSALDAWLLEPLAPRRGPDAWTTFATRGGFSSRVYAGDNCNLLAWDLDPGQAKGLAGFRIVRTLQSGASVVLPNQLRFRSEAASPENATDRHPIRSFHWVDDLPAGTASSAATYGISPMYGSPGKLKAGFEIELKIDPPPTGVMPIDAAFTRSIVFESDLGKSRVVDISRESGGNLASYGGNAKRAIFDLIAASASDTTCTLDVLAFELSDPDLLKSLSQMGQRLRVVLFDPIKKRWEPMRQTMLEATSTLKRAGASVSASATAMLAYDKTIIQRRGKKPVAVLTGSVGFTRAGLHGQQNYTITIRNEQVAAHYQQYFDEIWQSVSARPAIGASVRADGFPEMELSLGHATDKTLRPAAILEREAARARQSAFFVLNNRNVTPLELPFKRGGLSRGIVLEDVDTSFLFVNGYRELVKQPYLFRHRDGRQNVPAQHGRFLVTDFNQPNATVIAGSTTFGSIASRENVVVIRDQRIATIFAVEVHRLHQILWLYKQRKPASLDTNPNWWTPAFKRGSFFDVQRRLLLNAPSDHQVAKSPK